LSRKKKPQDKASALADIAIRAIEDLKGRDVQRLDVAPLTDVADVMIIAGGTSARHVKSIADNVVEKAKLAGIRPIGTEGTDAGEWILVDFGAVIVHVMGDEARRHYALEKLWTAHPADAGA
jgi:ribosome-associated protein